MPAETTSAAPGTAVITVHGQPRALADLDPAQLQAWAAECRASLPASAEYQVLYADPPWAYRMSAHSARLTGRAPYPMMSEAQLAALPVGAAAAPTSVLFLWATSPNLDQAIRVMRAWGFAYKTVWKVWLKRTASGKPVFGTGVWSRPSAELLLVGARGQGYTRWKTTNSERQEFCSPRGEHSVKPPELREAVRAFFDVPRRLELFARTRAPGFDAWGLEVPGFFAPAPPA